eukprot:UN32654
MPSVAKFGQGNSSSGGLRFVPTGKEYNNKKYLHNGFSINTTDSTTVGFECTYDPEKGYLHVFRGDKCYTPADGTSFLQKQHRKKRAYTNHEPRLPGKNKSTIMNDHTDTNHGSPKILHKKRTEQLNPGSDFIHHIKRLSNNTLYSASQQTTSQTFHTDTLQTKNYPTNNQNNI